MRRYLSLLFLACSLASFPLVTGMTCTPTQQKIAYNSLYTTGLAVNNAYAAYNDQVVAGKATFNVGVAKAYNDFQAALNIAVVAAQGNLQAVAPQNIVDLANTVYAAIHQYTK